MPDPQTLAAALDAVPDPATGRGLIAAGRAQPPRLTDGVVSVILDVSEIAEDERAPLEAAVTRALRGVAGVASVRVLMTAERAQRRLIAIGSGKGGVGKSTLSANLAVALARRPGMAGKIGLIDADIYGPSQPRLMAAEGSRPTAKDKIMDPVATRYGVPMLSMGQLVAPDKAIAWRGPMASGALGQMMEAAWGPAQTIVVDLPPGTGDIQLSMIQKHRPAGAVIVSTPQDLALIDARRAIDLFVQAGVPIIGLVENMSGYVCPHCGETSDPFGAGGAEAAAGALGIPFLGRVPLQLAIREASDAGTPPAAGDGPEAAPFHAVAAKVADWLVAR
jgi:ATP-binding protein involved in chromosome partitioning